MVLSHDITLKPSERAVLEFLLGVVFGPQRKLSTFTSRRECLRHDVKAASEIIRAYLEKAKKKRGFTDACHLVYGNTIVLAQQVARLLCDATRAREVLSYTFYLAEEEERRRRTREQMEKGIVDETPRKKKRRSKENEGFVLESPMTAHTADRQLITMRDVFAVRMEDNILPEDDLVPPTSEDFGMLYGLMGSEAVPSIDTSFLDRQITSSARRNLQNEIATIDDFDEPPVRTPSNPAIVPQNLFEDDFEYQQPRYEDIRPPVVEVARQEEPEELFDAAPHLSHLLLYGRMPLLEEGQQRRSMEDEMDDAREQAINADPPSQPPPDAFPRVSTTSTHFSMEEISPEDVYRQVGTPRVPRTPQTPRTPRPNMYNYTGNDSLLDAQTRFRIPLTAMHRMMENFSSLHYENGTTHLVKKQQKVTLKELMRPLPYVLQKGCHEDLLDIFNVGTRRCEPDVGNSGLHDEEEEEQPMEENLETPQNRRRRQPKLSNLPEIDLDNLAFYSTPLKSPKPSSPLHQIEEDPIQQFENPREHRIEPPPMEMDFDYPPNPNPSNTNLFVPDPEPIEEVRRTPQRSSIPGMERIETGAVLRDDPNYRFGMNRGFDRSASDDKTCAMFRSLILSECETASPYPIQFDSITPFKSTTRREAARAFYVVLELLKERRLKVVQISEYGQIDIRLSGEGSQDLEQLEQEEQEEEMEQEDDYYT